MHPTLYCKKLVVWSELLEAIKGRRSIRAFSGGEVSEEQLATLIDAARWAPSAGNLQPWEFISVRSPETKAKLARAAGGQSFVAEASVVVVVCADLRQAAAGYGERGASLYCIQDTAAATQNILLTAHAMGLGACWVGAFDEEAVRAVLKIPRPYRPVALIPIGPPAQRPKPRPRRSVEEILHREAF